MAPKPQPAAGGSSLDRLSPVAKFGLGFLFFFSSSDCWYSAFDVSAVWSCVVRLCSLLWACSIEVSRSTWKTTK